MEEYKYCFECGVEYYAHIENCVDCSVPLKTAVELEELKNQIKIKAQDKSMEPVVVKEGDKGWIYELYNHLLKEGFSVNITCSSCSTPGKCGETYQLIIPTGQAEGAVLSIEEYTHKVYPELKESFELSAQGKCPACGFEVGFEVTDCPDCGLILVTS